MDSTATSLGGYPAKKCPRVTHNLHAPDVTLMPGIDPDLQRLFDEGRAFEEEIVAAIAGTVDNSAGLAMLGGRYAGGGRARDSRRHGARGSADRPWSAALYGGSGWCA